MITRCPWVGEQPIYIDYHDKEWGKPEFDSQKLFEKICLEGQQAGLSWITVLKKRESYRVAFHQFDPKKIAKMTALDIDAWSFVNNKPIVNDVPDLRSVSAKTEISKALSKALKKRGFVFVGETTCYAFMQSMGLVDDHLNDCPCKTR